MFLHVHDLLVENSEILLKIKKHSRQLKALNVKSLIPSHVLLHHETSQLFIHHITNSDTMQCVLF